MGHESPISSHVGISVATANVDCPKLAHVCRAVNLSGLVVGIISATRYAPGLPDLRCNGNAGCLPESLRPHR